MDSEEPKLRGIVSEVGIERDEEHFRSFNIKIGVLLKSEKRIDYDEGERMMRSLRKEILGKDVEVTTIIIRCPICGRGFKSEQGMNQHKRMMHTAQTKKKAKKTRKTTKTKKSGKAKSGSKS